MGTVYKEDDEAEKIWIEKEGVSKDRTLDLVKKTIWSMGDGSLSVV